MEKFFIGQAVIREGRIYRIEDIISSEKKGISYKIAGYSAPLPAYVNGEYAGLQIGDMETIFIREEVIKPYANT